MKTRREKVAGKRRENAISSSLDKKNSFSKAVKEVSKRRTEILLKDLDLR